MENGFGSSALSLCLDFHTISFSIWQDCFPDLSLVYTEKSKRGAQTIRYSQLAKMIIKIVKSDFPHKPKNVTQQILHQAHKFWS